MKIQLSQKRIVPDAVTVWNEPGPEVDIVMPIDKLSFAKDSIEEMYVFHVLEHLFVSEIPGAIANWKSQMMPGKDIYIVADDFEFIARALLGGELDIDTINERFSYPTLISRDNLTRYMEGAGYIDADMKFWFVDVPNLFKKEDYEIVISAIKR